MANGTSEEVPEYRNKTVINQRGAAIAINNSTDREELKLSQYSGSNISLNNLVNSELATNNKQTKIINDNFETVGKDKNTWVGKDRVERVVENTYSLRGFTGNAQLSALDEWRATYKDIADKNSEFLIHRGGQSFPNGVKTEQDGKRLSPNSTFNQVKVISENTFPGYGDDPNNPVPVRSHDVDEVSSNAPLGGERVMEPAAEKQPTENDIREGSGPGPGGPVNLNKGTNAPGINAHGPTVNSATEGGDWVVNEDHTNLGEDIVDLQEDLNPIEQKIGNGGDEISFVKRHKFETIGGVNNNYPSVRIDPQGRSQPIEVAVGETMSYVNVDFVPHVEEVNNDMNFPAGVYTLNVGNSYNVIVGSGGVQIKTSGAIELGGTTIKASAYKINLQAESGVHITSNSLVELQSQKSISLRSARQIYIEPGLGVKNNLLVGGGSYTEGEIFVHHITAPVEIQQTEDTELYGQFNANCARQLQIGEAKVGSEYYPVYALPTPDLIYTYPHSHHFKNLPLRLMNSNEDVRRKAQCENINKNGFITPALQPSHTRKQPLSTTGPEEGCVEKTVSSFGPADFAEERSESSNPELCDIPQNTPDVDIDPNLYANLDPDTIDDPGRNNDWDFGGDPVEGSDSQTS
tara:strand:+ start:835 stop:2733 length:1899 start_codon:yes stop_codon:yes gene_type:complete